MSQTAAATEHDVHEEQLNKAIEELRDVLKEEENRPGAKAGADATARNAGVIMNIPVDVQIVLGSAEMPVSELMALQKGSTVALNRRIGEPVDVVVNGRNIAQGRDHRARKRSVAVRYPPDRDHQRGEAGLMISLSAQSSSQHGAGMSRPLLPDTGSEGRRHPGGDGQAIGQPRCLKFFKQEELRALIEGARAAAHHRRKAISKRSSPNSKRSSRKAPAFSIWPTRWTPSSTSRSRPKRSAR